MDTNALKKFAQGARNLLIDQVTAKLDLVLDAASPARREHPSAIKKLEAAIKTTSRTQIIEQVAYTWFNRFTALRYMDAAGLTNPRVVSPTDGATRPEILSEAMAGNVAGGASPQITELLQGTRQAHDPQAEAYRLLLIHACHDWHKVMPWLFEALDDYTELLMPDDLLSQTSILARLRDVMTTDACKDVEIIGWLYQFYVSEKKDQVFAGLKKNQKITAENIPAATQLFTPHWIVRYLVENSLGRLWLLNRPNSGLAAKMEYYIAPEEPETDFLRIDRPEDIRICDPAAGSGHMLTYAFDLLFAIYEEEGYAPDTIPELILRHNLTGVEIDDRAGALAAFALAMKAAAKLGRRRFLRMAVQPDICVLQNVAFTPAEMQDVAAVVGKDLFTDALRETLGQFEQAKNFGSLILPKLRDPAEALRVVEARDFGGDLLLKEVQARVVAVLRMAEALSPKYHVVVANPPYMGGKGMDAKLSDFLKGHFPSGRTDLFAAFIERGRTLIQSDCFYAMVTMEAWMFLSSFEELRSDLLAQSTLHSMVHMPYLGKGGTSMGINFGTTAFVAKRRYEPQWNGQYICVRYYETDDHGVPFSFPVENERRSMATTKNFQSIPTAPIAYWFSAEAFEAFAKANRLEDTAKARRGLSTGDNEAFVRFWHEVSDGNFSFGVNPSTERWYPYHKGGDFRRWFGNNELIVNWEDGGRNIKNQPPKPSGDRGWRTTSEEFYLQPGITWTGLTSGSISFRASKAGFLFDTNKGPMMFPDQGDFSKIIGYLNSKPTAYFLAALNPTMSTQNEDIDNLPFSRDLFPNCEPETERLVKLGKSDWDAYETSWDFTTLPLLQPDHRAETLAGTYTTLRTHWQGMTDEMLTLEEENNRIFIDAYGLQDELTPEVPLNEITLTCNPAYRYGIKNDAEANETRLRADTMAEFLSYSVGCMFGRYSLDAPGLILANQGNTLADYLTRVPSPSFMPDEDNVIPVLDGDWFADDITERFRLFLRVTFGEDKFRENLGFIEDALGKDIRKYFTRDFYSDHVKRYKKRPIYWMFASPKGTFSALIYMHRYRPDTVSVILNEYLREFITKLEAERAALEKQADDPTATQGQRTKAMKDVGVVMKQIEELTEWEREVVFPLAQAKIDIDLDEGVKANYPKFGTALKKIAGLEASDD
jgi:hypothetical protein